MFRPSIISDIYKNLLLNFSEYIVRYVSPQINKIIGLLSRTLIFCVEFLFYPSPVDRDSSHCHVRPMGSTL